MEYDYHFKFEQAISTKFGPELSYGAPTLLDEVMAVLCSAVEAAKEPGAKLEVWPSLTHGRYSGRVLCCGVVLTKDVRYTGGRHGRRRSRTLYHEYTLL